MHRDYIKEYFRKSPRLYFGGLICLTILFFGMTKNSLAATYYIDYINGSNSNDGISESTAFKACPGDINNSEAAYTGQCTGNCASVNLVTGDMVYFKKGVSYVGRIEVNSAGAQTATGTLGSVTAGGLFTDADGPFAAVRAGHYIFIYHAQSEIRNESTSASDPQ